MDMDCPACKNAMIVLELDQVEVDYCTNCGGIWLDAGELELLLEDTKNTQELLNSFEKAKDCRENPRKCPICLKKMQKILVSDDQIIDKCTRGDGLWFDKGELQNILAMAKLDKDHKIQKLLADMFGATKNN